LIEEAIAAHPTFLELLITKARVLKRMGDFAAAADALETARAADTADRYAQSMMMMMAIGIRHINGGSIRVTTPSQ
jgi:hypothetical protein